MNKYSGKFVVRMPGALHAMLKDEAMRTGKSLNQVCIQKLQGQAAVTGAPAVNIGPFLPDFLEAAVRYWRKELAGLVLFGSAARGDATGESDVDLMLVMKRGIKIARGLYRAWDEFCGTYRGAQDHARISPHFVGLPESPVEAGGLWYETAIEGIVLWEMERRISRFLWSLRSTMAQGTIRRRTLHGSPYWIKEPGVMNAQ